MKKVYSLNEALQIFAEKVTEIEEKQRPIPKIAHIGCGSPAFVREPMSWYNQSYLHPGGMPLFAVACKENAGTLKLNISGIDTPVKIFNKDGVDITHLITTITVV